MCDKVREKGRTTYTEVANEIVAETVSQTGDFDEKNIRRRVYDALNVLMALNIVHKEKNKERTISWVGLPTSNSSHDKSHVSYIILDSISNLDFSSIRRKIRYSEKFVRKKKFYMIYYCNMWPSKDSFKETKMLQSISK